MIDPKWQESKKNKKGLKTREREWRISLPNPSNSSRAKTKQVCHD